MKRRIFKKKQKSINYKKEYKKLYSKLKYCYSEFRLTDTQKARFESPKEYIDFIDRQLDSDLSKEINKFTRSQSLYDPYKLETIYIKEIFILDNDYRLEVKN